ncbi:MAG: 4-alpha-glucanotransferase [Minicystis sp.]
MAETKSTSSAGRRVAGVTVPLFSLRGPRSWGIGEIGDLPAFAQWVREAGLRLVQLLPLGEISGGETSPYAALTAFGIDPIYISLADVPDLGNDAQEALDRARLHRAPGDSAYTQLARARESRTVDYAAVRTLKQHALRAAFNRFYEGELLRGTPRAAAFRAFVQQNETWLADYALFRALKDAHQGVAWWDFRPDLRDRRPKALAEARVTFAREVLYHQYTQWTAHTQWYDARARLRAIGVEIMGDLPFMVGRDSADVWANQGEFRDDAGVGAPPDAFNEEGQDWGLPPYDWRVMRANDFAWLRRRCRYTASLYDRFRIDHLIGFYRTYMRLNEKRLDERGKLRPGFFDPGEEEAQLDHGERVLSAMLEASREGGAQLIAEDLGVIPPWVRRSLAKLGVPGYKVLIWEKDQKDGKDVFRDPAAYPPVSLACFGTHDTSAVAVWWEGLGAAERTAVKALPGLAPHAAELGETFTPAVHRALLDLLNGSASELVLFLIQDLLGTKERINTPATIGAHNWTYRLPGTIDELRANPAVFKLTEMMRKSIEKTGR